MAMDSEPLTYAVKSLYLAAICALMAELADAHG